MCTKQDYSILTLLPEHRAYIETELQEWHEQYLPIKRNACVLDVGSGSLETALFYILHGASRVVCVEANKKALRLARENRKRILRKFPDARIEIIDAMIDNVKLDIEGSEENAVIEVHFAHEIREWKRENGWVSVLKIRKRTLQNLAVKGIDKLVSFTR